jgi:hypothetical protein
MRFQKQNHFLKSSLFSSFQCRDFQSVFVFGFITPAELTYYNEHLVQLVSKFGFGISAQTERETRWTTWAYIEPNEVDSYPTLILIGRYF